MAFAHVVYQSGDRTSFLRLSGTDTRRIRAELVPVAAGAEAHRTLLTFKTDNERFFRELGRSIAKEATTFTLKTNGKAMEITGSLSPASRAALFQIAGGGSVVVAPGNGDSEETAYAIGVGGVAIVAILVIGAMTVAYTGGSFSASAEKDGESASASVEASGGSQEGGSGSGEGGGGGDEQGN